MLERMLGLVAGAWLCASAWGQAGMPEEISRHAAVAERLSPSLVRVQYTMRYDKGEEPHAFPETVTMEYPHEEPGFLIAPTRVVTEDLMLHPRFVERITVRFGAQVVRARPVGYGVEQDALFLELEEPLPGARAMSFEPHAEGPYLAARYAADDDLGWVLGVSPMGTGVASRDGGPAYVPVETQTIVTTREGSPVALTMTGELPVSGEWRTPPEEWEVVTQADLEATLARLEGVTSEGVLRTTLNFRSPRSQAGRFNQYGGMDEEEITRWDGSSIVVDEQTVLVLAMLTPKVTARLEEIRLHRPDGSVMTAEFVGSLKDYGAMLARTDEPIAGALRLTDQEVTAYRDRLLYKAEVLVQGENRVAYFGREWYRQYYVGWRGMILPQRAGVRYAQGYYGQPSGPATVEFPFDGDLRLVGAPVHRRMRGDDAGGYWGAHDGSTLILPGPELARILANPDEHVDPNIRPLSEDEENRVAWLGVELQPLDQELARMQSVSDQTRDGQSGAIVTAVYPDSPAAEMGLAVGDILLRVHTAERPRPLDVALHDYAPGMEGFWSFIDEIPEMYFSQIPTPWPAADNSFNEALTDLGVGAACTLEYVRNGQLRTSPFEVTLGPEHFGSTKRVTDEDLGVTVRNMTYEVRRYFRLETDAPGVIISKIEEGSKGSVAGLKPYEYITHVNDQPVHSVEEFEGLVGGAEGELRLSVRRMTTGRIVKIRR